MLTESCSTCSIDEVLDLNAWKLELYSAKIIHAWAYLFWVSNPIVNTSVGPFTWAFGPLSDSVVPEKSLGKESDEIRRATKHPSVLQLMSRHGFFLSQVCLLFFHAQLPGRLIW